MLSHITFSHLSSVRWIITFANIAWKTVPILKQSEQNTSNSENEKEVELDGKILYQKNEETEENLESSDNLSEKKEKSKLCRQEIIPETTKSETQTSEYLSIKIGKMIFWTIFSDIPIWTAKCLYFHPNFIMMILYTILPAHIWIRIFPRLLALLR